MKPIVKGFLIFAGTWNLVGTGTGWTARPVVPPTGQASGGPRESTAFPAWTRRARVGGLSLASFHVTTHQITLGLDDLQNDGVDTVRVVTRAVDFLDEADFERERPLARRVASPAGDKNLHVLWTLPLLEVITPEGRVDPMSIGRRHPDWLAVSFDRRTLALDHPRRPAGAVHRDEVVWMCPTGGYVDFILDRLRALAGTGIDGIWLTGIGYDGARVRWSCACDRCRDRFRRESGLAFPSVVDLGDRRFRRFLAWRHEVLADLLARCAAVVRSVDPAMVIVADVGSLDGGAASRHGLDAASLRDVIPAFDVPTVSPVTGMAHASEQDRITQLALYRWCRGAAGPAPGWAYCSGFASQDLELALGACLAARLNPFELLGSQASISANRSIRTKFYDWLEQHERTVFDARSTARAAILFSSTSRDHLDGLDRAGAYVTWARPRRDLQWFAETSEDGLGQSEYGAEWRGWAEVLIRSGIPFDVLTEESLVDADLALYRCILVPRGVSLGDRTAGLLGKAAAGGTALVLTGELAGSRGPDGTRRGSRLFGEGTAAADALRIPELLGRKVIGGDRRAFERARRHLMESRLTPVVDGEAPIYVQTYRSGDTDVLHALPFGSPATGEVHARFEIPFEGKLARIRILAPGMTPREIEGVAGNGLLRFEAAVSGYSLLVIDR